MAPKRNTADTMQVRKEKKRSDEKKNVSTTPWGKIMFFTVAAIVAASSYYIYVLFTTPPPLPEVDLEYWWGAEPKDAKQDQSIRPYRIEFSDVMVHDLQERLLHRRDFVQPLENVGFTYGFNSAFLARVLDYWQNKYNFEQREEYLNRYDHFMTNIQGLDIHYMHVRPEAMSQDIKVLPLLMLHGWPGSIREFYEIIPKLTKVRHGHKFVFEIIVPSLPGFGFSQATSKPGLGSLEIAVIMKNLMDRIGIEKYYIQGGDAGHVVGSIMATLFPEKVMGFHTNFPATQIPSTAILTVLGSFWPSLVVEKELEERMYPLSKHFSFLLEESGYLHIQASKPDTVGIALTDSPAGLAAYILEKFSTWTNPTFKKASDGELLKKYELTNLLDNVMIYWSTKSITTSMRLYSETLNKRHMQYQLDAIPTSVPTWGIKFKYELNFTPDWMLKMKYKNYLQSTHVEDGGHFAAFENPEIMAKDIFDAVEAFEEFHGADWNKSGKESIVDYETAESIYEFTVRDINGRNVKLDRYRGHVTIIVNVASQCGLTDTNYKQLNELYEKYGESKGLRILAFPCNQFNNQEPGDFKDIINFTRDRKVKFDIFEKIEVNGANAHPLWKFLKHKLKGTMGDFIKWNFSKFIIDKNGVPVERLGPNVDPLDLEPYLAKYW